MQLLSRVVDSTLVVRVGRGAIADLGPLLADSRISGGGGVAVVVGPGQGDWIAELVRRRLGPCDIIQVVGGTLESAMDLREILRASSFGCVVGIGGGKTIDTAKYAASLEAIPMVSVPTSLASDSIASPVASLARDGGKASFGVSMPVTVVVDVDVVETAPARYSQAGIGDAISNISAVADWELGHRVLGESVDGLSATLARIGAEALINRPGTITTEGFLTTLAEALILGGISMAICGSSRPASGGCHEISHAIDRLYPDAGLHGEQVALGALFCTFLRGDRGRFASLRNCLRRHGLPVMPTDLGLTDEQFAAAVEIAPDTRPGRYTILEHLSLSPSDIRGRLAEYADALNNGTDGEEHAVEIPAIPTGGDVPLLPHVGPRINPTFRW